MISVDTRGRMGNQMFQLAFAHVAARRLGTSFVLGPSTLWEGFDIGPWGRRPVRVARRLAFRARHGAIPHDKVEISHDEDPASVLAGLRDGVAYGGFFQSERYLTGYEDEVRAMFAVRAEHVRRFEQAYESLGRYVCVHLRRGDYHEWMGGRALPTSYFLDALASIEDLDGMAVVVISDDLEGARVELADVEGVRFEANEAMLDLQLLMNAAVVVTSNSSFSWWGAWLNRVEDARVIAPEHWVGFPEGRELPRDVIAAGWERILVRATP